MKKIILILFILIGISVFAQELRPGRITFEDGRIQLFDHFGGWISFSGSAFGGNLSHDGISIVFEGGVRIIEPKALKSFRIITWDPSYNVLVENNPLFKYRISTITGATVDVMLARHAHSINVRVFDVLSGAAISQTYYFIIKDPYTNKNVLNIRMIEFGNFTSNFDAIGALNGIVYRLDGPQDNLNVRSKPNTSGEILTKLKNGDNVIVLGQTKDSWYKIRTSLGIEGYCSGQYLNVDRQKFNQVSVLDATGNYVVSITKAIQLGWKIMNYNSTGELMELALNPELEQTINNLASATNYINSVFNW